MTGVPLTFQAAVQGAGACPDVSPTPTLCADPVVGLNNGGGYSLSLDPGTWVVWGFYEASLLGGAVLSAPSVVTVTSGSATVLDFAVPYAKPAALDGTVTVTGAPTGLQVTSASIILCPTGIPFAGGMPSLACANDSVATGASGTTATATVSGLPAGTWTAYPGYCTSFGCTSGPTPGKTVVTTAGRTTRVHLTLPYQPPPNGMLDASVAVTGAPAGFNDPVGLTACQIQVQFGYCQDVGGNGPSGSFNLMLADGVWEISGYYSVPPFGNAIVGPVELVNVQGGQTTNLTLDVPYQVLGTATGSIKIAGLPPKVHPTSYSVTACPDGGSPVGLFSFGSCVTEYSGPGSFVYGAADAKRFGRSTHRATLRRAAGTKFNTYDLPTLTPGRWDIYVSYTTPFGYFDAPNDTVVDVTAGQTTTTKLTVPYQAPWYGVLTGTVNVVGAPAYAFEAGVRACSSPPVAGSCSLEQDAYLGSNGTYQLNLSPGTWWVSGVAYVYTGATTQEITTTPIPVTAAAGVQLKQKFTVKVS